jgi:hypothetical protein
VLPKEALILRVLLQLAAYPGTREASAGKVDQDYQDEVENAQNEYQPGCRH